MIIPNGKAKRAWIISDTHFGARNNSVEWLDRMTLYFEEFFIPHVKENYKKGDILIHCGDVYDNRQSVNLLVLNKTLSLFEKFSEIFVDGIYVIAGNHDIMRKNSNEVTSLDTLKYIPNVTILKEPATLKTKHCTSLLMPWRKSESDEKVVVSGSDADYLFCHTTIRGAKFDKYRHSGEGLASNECKQFKKVFTGHIHLAQQYKNIRYVGNPYQMTRSDTNNKKGFICLDFETGTEDFYENTYSSKFVKLYINRALDSTMQDLINAADNNFVDVYVPNDYLMKYQVTPLIDALSKVSKKLDVIPFELDDNDNLMEYDIDYDKTLDTYNLCEKFVEGMSIEGATKTKVLSLLKQVYLQNSK
jgi:DNA repair exonuclease SbcCD nuclease subunit